MKDRWRWRHLLASPHRLGFFLAMVVLVAAGLWWAAVQLQRSGVIPPLPMPVSPSLAHAAVMTFGFFPLFFCGFLFTAGPRWLHVRGPAARNLVPAFSAQAAGWLAWLATTHVSRLAAAAALALAAAGVLHAAMKFWHLVGASTDDDRLHARVIAAALAFGGGCVVTVAIALLADADDLAMRVVLSGLWGCVVVVFVTAAHRMIPFFNPPPGTWLDRQGNRTQLALLAGVAAFEAASVWLQPAWPRWWPWLAGAVELGVGAALACGAVAWSFTRPLRDRLLRMMHTGLVWIAAGFALQGATTLAARFTRTMWLPLAPLHAFAMGGLGTLMLAMVTRVSAAHAGQAIAADDAVWTLFWLLQLATALRIIATVPGAPMQELLTLAALAWAGLMTVWGLRYGWGYGHPSAVVRQR